MEISTILTCAVKIVYAPRVPPRPRRGRGAAAARPRHGRGAAAAAAAARPPPRPPKKKKSKNIFSDFVFGFVASVFHHFRQIWEELGLFDVKIRFLEVFCFGWSNFQVGTTLGAKIMLIGPATAPRAQATGEG